MCICTPEIRTPYCGKGFCMDTSVTSVGIGASPKQGWQCPVCNNVYSPVIPGCMNCNKPKYGVN